MSGNVYNGPFNDGYRIFPEPAYYPNGYFIIVGVFVIIDVCFVYILHKTGLRIPDISNNNINLIKNNDKNKPTQYNTKLKRFVHNHLLYPDYSGYYINNIHLSSSKNEVLSYWNYNETFIDIMCRPNNPRLNVFVYVKYAFRIYYFLCGILSLSSGFVFFLGATADYIVVVLKFKKYFDFIILIWISYVIFWLLRKFFFGVYLMFYNICDKYDMWIVFYWRFIVGLINLFGAGGLANAERKYGEFNDNTDINFGRWFAVIMLLRGTIYLALYIIISLIHSVIALYRMFRKKIDYSIRINIVEDIFDTMQNRDNNDIMLNKTDEQDRVLELKWWMLLFNIDPRHTKNERIFYIVYTSIIWILILFYVILLIANGWPNVKDTSIVHGNLIKWILVSYYILSILARTRQDALFYFWSGIYHFRYHELLVSFHENNGNKVSSVRSMKPRMFIYAFKG